jgi:serine phosphatase RsbU (regulator of sigma subunit)
MIFIKGPLLLAFYLLLTTCIYSQVNEQNLMNEISVYRAENKPALAAEALNKLAFFYWENSMPEKALETFEQSVALNIEIRNNNAVKAIYSNMGMINTDMGQPETALVFFRKSLLLSRSQSNKQDIATNLINIAVALNSLNRSDEAAVNLNEALAIISALKNKSLLRTCYGVLAETYQEIGESQKSMEYFTLYNALLNELQQEELSRQKKQTEEKIAKVEEKAQQAIQEKKQTEEKLVVTQDSLKIAEEINQINQLMIENQLIEIKNQRLLTLIFVIGMIFILIVALFILRSNQQKKRHNAILEKRNEEIRAKNHKINQSINYAKNIQGALLPEIDQYEKLYPESFIFFSPRDVVSGDFYWFDQIQKDRSNYKISAAIDCTGHGVPGAFMSMLGMSFLEEIILDKGVVSPDEILENMHKMIKTALRQEISGNTDGMDMTICVHDELRKVIKFAGAVNPLVYIQNGKMDVLKGDYFGIGGQMKESQGKEKKFALQILDVSVPTTCYIFTDGFADQFGGEKGRKYFMKNFRELLLNIHEKPMVEQNSILKSKLEEWHGVEYQRLDDVLIMGFKV